MSRLPVLSSSCLHKVREKAPYPSSQNKGKRNYFTFRCELRALCEQMYEMWLPVTSTEVDELGRPSKTFALTDTSCISME